MPTPLHETIVELFRDHPALASELLREALPYEPVARWAREAIALGGGNRYSVAVIGPGDLPRPTAEQARAHPHLAMLATLAHARGPQDAPLVVQMLGILGEVRGSDAVVYHQLMLASLDEAVRAAVEALMKTITPETIDPILKPAYMKGRKEGREEGREEGRALAILSVLAARGLVVSDEQRALVLGCRDGELLETWLGRAAVERSVEEVLSSRQ